MNRPCPDCPDGYLWNSNGQTAKACPTCGGKAYLPCEEDEPLAPQAIPSEEQC